MKTYRRHMIKPKKAVRKKQDNNKKHEKNNLEMTDVNLNILIALNTNRLKSYNIQKSHKITE